MKYLAVDIGGTKTLIAVFDAKGKVVEKVKFPTDASYPIFFDELSAHIKKLKHQDFKAAGVAVPGMVDRKHGIGLNFGNLPWQNVRIESQLEKLLDCPVRIENDANLAGLSEANLVIKDYKKVLYITISTGIGTGIITSGIIDPELADSEGGHIMLEHNGKFQSWESFASGRAIVKRYGKKASEITDPDIWQRLAHDFAVGILDLTAVIQPEAIIIGGGVGQHFERFGAFLKSELARYATPLTPTPRIFEAKRAEEAVIYGCYDLVRAKHG